MVETAIKIPNAVFALSLFPASSSKATAQKKQTNIGIYRIMTSGIIIVYLSIPKIKIFTIYYEKNYITHFGAILLYGRYSPGKELY